MELLAEKPHSRHTTRDEIYVFNPLVDSRWDDLVAHHPRASVFHQRGWLEALARTYGYEPFALTTSPPSEPLSDGIVLCRVSSWLTGSRLVSIPFSDHCEPLLSDGKGPLAFMNWLHAECDRREYKYIEVRPLPGVLGLSLDLQLSSSYWLHELDMKPSLEQIFQAMHKNSFRRKIRRAEREGLSYETGCSNQLMNEFYRLLLMTRRRHELLPQPRKWFDNLIECLGDSLQIRLCRKSRVPIAAIVTLRHRSSAVYKYGCSDAGFHNLGAMPFLFWRFIEDCKASGIDKIDFGRSDLDQAGLITLKDRSGATKKLLNYYRYSNRKKSQAVFRLGSQWAKTLFPLLPDAVLSAAGRVLYRHAG
jgi:hypothetical protein